MSARTTARRAGRAAPPERARIAIAIAGLVALAACGGEEVRGQCALPDGRIYYAGDFFPAGDGCNTCMCDPAVHGGDGYACTLVACPDRSGARLCEPVSGTACARGPACGDGCCGQGELCVGEVCECGGREACAADEICDSPSPIGADGCGFECAPRDPR